MKKPKVSVVMPVFNGEKYLKQAIESILNQTFKYFELIIVNDASTDKTEKIIKSFTDKRIKLINNQKNLGVAKSLNIGLKKAKGSYIARMDTDDISMAKRLEKQVEFLKKNPKVVLVGSQCSWINFKGQKINGFKVATDDLIIRKKMFIRNQFHHASVMFKKKDVLKLGGYKHLFNGAEDYELWFRFSDLGKLYNLPEELISRRLYNEAISSKKHFKIEIIALIIRLKNLPKLI